MPGPDHVLRSTDGAEVVYIAVGTNFPDALAGAAQAAAWGAPMLLTPTNALPQAVIDEIARLDPHTIVILGGEAVISPAVEAQLGALLGCRGGREAPPKAWARRSETG